MSPREILHQLVEELPSADIPTAERVLQALSAAPPPHVPLDMAPCDHEPDDDDFDGGLTEARAAVEAGRVVDQAEVEIRLFPPEHDRSLRGILAPHVRATPPTAPERRACPEHRKGWRW